jgi:hypothetical protein
MSSAKSPRKLVKRGKSPGHGESEGSRPSSPVNGSERRGRNVEVIEPGPSVPQKLDKSERDLALRLELAKQNSLSQQAVIADTASFMLRDPPFAETIYEGKFLPCVHATLLLIPQ